MCKKVSRVEKGDKEDEIAIGKRKIEPHAHHVVKGGRFDECPPMPQQLAVAFMDY